MKILSITGNSRTKVTFETDEGVYYGGGELLVDGFMVLKDGLVDSEDRQVSKEKKDEIIAAVAVFLHGKQNAMSFFFEN